MSVVNSQMKRNIIINLEDSSDARAFYKSDEIIQQEAMRSFFRHVSDSLRKVDYFRTSLYSGTNSECIRYHDTITVAGGRGSGKTTFILSMLEILRDGGSRAGLKDATGKINDSIEVLGVLDPTLIEEKDHIFVNIISLIKERIDSVYDCHTSLRGMNPQQQDNCSHFYQEHHGVIPITDECYRDWLGSLQILAAGLPALDGVGDHNLRSEKWHDPIYVLEQGLRNTTASIQLESNFHRFIDRSLQLLGKKAFIIAFDDIDTNFKSGWPVLEVIRKYLTTPQMVTVLSGDLDLYSILARTKQWENFGEIITKAEGMLTFQSMVEKLEAQYLLKLLKPERHVELKTLHYLCEGTTSSYEAKHVYALNVSWLGKPEPEHIVAVINSFLEHVFKVSGSDKALYRSHIMRNAVRSVMRVLHRYADQVQERAQGPLHDVILDIAQSAIHHFGFHQDILREPDPRIAINQLAIGLAGDETANTDFKRSFRLKADFEEPGMNMLMLALGAIYTSLLARHPNLVFEYFVKIGLTREIEILTERDQRFSLRHYLEWVGIRQGETSVTVARYFGGYIRSMTAVDRQKPTLLGTIALVRPWNKQSASILRFRSTAKKMYGISMNGLETDDALQALRDATLDEKHPLHVFRTAIAKEIGDFHPPGYAQDFRGFYINTMEELDDRITSWHWRLVNIAVNRNVNRFNAASILWSIHTLIAVMGELAVAQTPGEISSLLTRHSQIRDYPLPDQPLESSTDKKSRLLNFELDDTDQRIIDIKESDPIPTSVQNQILDWSTSYRKIVDRNLPVHIIGKIFTRLHYSLGRVDDDLPLANQTLGSLVHRYVAIFLNAVLVEEVLHREVSRDEPVNVHAKRLSLMNPTKTDYTLINNLNLWKDTTSREQDIPFFSWIFNFPLWRYYIDNNSSLFQLLSPTVETDQVTFMGFARFNGLSDILNSVVVAGYRYRPPHAVAEDAEDETEEDDISPPSRRYSNELLNEIFENNRKRIIEELYSLIDRPEEMTREFSEKFLNRLTHVPQKGPIFNALVNRLTSFMKGNAPRKP